MKRFVYADNAATTQIIPPVLEAMMPYLTEEYGNPSSLYGRGQKAHAALDTARRQVADALGAEPKEIIFTACGSEADNWVIKMLAKTLKDKGKHIISSAFEHHAVLYPLQELEKEGYEVTYLPVHEDGLVRPEELEAAIRQDTILVTIMFANNEIGTIQPIPQLSAIAKAHGVLFHTDAVQAVGHIPVNVKEMGIDLLSLSGHKFHAPKGVGALYIRKGVRLPNYLSGGAQENNRRAGTENVASIVGMGKALELACANLEENTKKVLALRERLIDGVLSTIPYVRLNGDRERRLPGNANFSFDYIEGESILLRLDLNGISASSGSACTSGSLDPSHVLLALGMPHETAHGSLRLTLSELNTQEDVDYILEVLPNVIQVLRDMSPLYEKVAHQSGN